MPTHGTASGCVVFPRGSGCPAFCRRRIFSFDDSPKLLGVRRSCNIGGKLLISEGLRWVWVGRKGCQIDLCATATPLALLVVSVCCMIPKIYLLGMQVGDLFGGGWVAVNACDSVCIWAGVSG